MISTPHALLSPPEEERYYPRYTRNENHRKGNLILHNNNNDDGNNNIVSKMSYHSQNPLHHQDAIVHHKRQNELSEFYPPPPKLTTFSTEDASGIQAEQQQSYHYMVSLSSVTKINEFIQRFNIVTEFIDLPYKILLFQDPSRRSTKNNPSPNVFQDRGEVIDNINVGRKDPQQGYGASRQSSRGHHKHCKCSGHHSKDGNNHGSRHCSHGHKNHRKHHHHHYRESSSSKNGTMSSTADGKNFRFIWYKK